jgi:hypothetical protein
MVGRLTTEIDSQLSDFQQELRCGLADAPCPDPKRLRLPEAVLGCRRMSLPALDPHRPVASVRNGQRREWPFREMRTGRDRRLTDANGITD